MELVKWGFDAASIEQQIGDHRRTHNAIGDYRWHLDKVKTDLVITVFPYMLLSLDLYHWLASILLQKGMLSSSASLQKVLVSQ